MSDEDKDKPAGKLPLGQYLASIRKDRKMTLREVEEATQKSVSNAYLSQIESGKIQQPSPNILHALAELYSISYENLMELSGYIVATDTAAAGLRHGRVATFAEHNLTPEEQAELLDYLKFMRGRKRKDDQS